MPLMLEHLLNTFTARISIDIKQFGLQAKFTHTHTSTVQKNIHTQALTSIYCVQANENPYPNPNHAGRSYSLPLLPQLKTMTHSMNNKDTSYFYDV